MRISRGSASADAARTAVLPCQRGALGRAPERRNGSENGTPKGKRERKAAGGSGPAAAWDGLHEPKSAQAHARYPNQTMRPWREV